MDGQPKGRRSARGRVAAAIACAVVAAVIGGACFAAPANADALPTTSVTSTDEPTPIDAGPTGATLSTTATSTVLAGLSVARSSNTVYPVKDGFQDSVQFMITAKNTTGRYVTVVGAAVLSKGGRIIETWQLDGSKRVIVWNGRVATKVRTGLYRLTVTAWSPDGSRKVADTNVRVLDKHLVRHVLRTRTAVGAHTVSGDMPHHLLKAFRLGLVTIRIRTVATVTGPAKLVFTNNGVTRTLRLRDGTFTSGAMSVPEGFAHVSITHAWAKGAAHLRSLEAIWIHYDLV